MENNKQYLLVIKRGNNDYVPIEWRLLPSYKNEDLTTLKGIDTFTSKQTEIDLLKSLIETNLISPTDKFEQFAIIFQEKGKRRNLKEGTIFQNKIHYTNPQFIVDTILKNIENKQFINNLSNICKSENIKVQEFKFILKNMKVFKEKGKNAVIAAVSKYNEIPYEFQRKLSFEIIEKLLP